MKDPIFGDLLTTGVRSIAARQGRTILAIEDEIGIGVNRGGRSAIEYWRKGNIPDPEVIKFITRECIEKGGLDAEWARRFVRHGRLLDGEDFIRELFTGQRIKIPTAIDDGAILSDLGKNESSVRHNLPARSEFFGRLEEKKMLRAALASRSNLITVEGISGAGKTALVLEVCFDLLSELQIASKITSNTELDSALHFNVIVWQSARLNQGLPFDSFLNSIARVMRYPKILGLNSQDKLLAVKDLLRYETVLLFLDNMEFVTDALTLDFLRELPEPTKAVMTSSRQIFQESRVVQLGGLTPPEARLLLTDAFRKIGKSFEKVPRNEELFNQLYEITSGIPLVLHWAVRQTRRGDSLKHVIDRLYGAKEDIHEQVFSQSWSLLSDDAKKLLSVASLWPLALSREAIASAIQTDYTTIQAPLSQLLELWLMETNGRLTIDGESKYRLHTLTRIFVAQKQARNEIPEKQVSRRLSEYYLQYAEMIRDRWGDSMNRNRFEEERENFLEAAQSLFDDAMSGEPDCYEKVIRLANVISEYLLLEGYWNELILLSNMAVECAKVNNDIDSLEQHLGYIGEVYLGRGDIERAKQCILLDQHGSREQSKIPRSVGQRLLQARVATQEGDYDSAESHLLEILGQAKLSADQEGRPAILVHLGVLSSLRGDYQSAKNRFLEALVLDEQLQTVEGQAVSLSYLGQATLNLGDASTSKIFFERGLSLAIEVQRVSTIGRCQLGLAQISFRMGKWKDATKYGQQALELFERLGMSSESEQARGILGELENRNSL